MYLWLWPEGKEVLLEMTIRPLLSHQRENATAVGRLRDVLKVYGAGGWKDTEDLRIGEETQEGVRRAISQETGGLIWWGTRGVLSSWFVTKIEIPLALQRKKADPLYPVVPLFIDLDPGKRADRDDICLALEEYGQDFLDCNGLVRRGAESADAFRRRIAKRYLRDAVRALGAAEPAREITVAFRALSEPSGLADLTFDWRALIDPRGRALRPGAAENMLAALESARDALQAAFSRPCLSLDLDLPLPIAFLVGYEWRITTRLQLTVHQRTGCRVMAIDASGESSVLCVPTRAALRRTGPVVVAVSCLDGFGRAAERYAAEVGASELVTLHVPGILGSAALRGLAQAAASELRNLNNRGVEKHLLILGPVVLAVLIGMDANASGPVTCPFWQGSRYGSPVRVPG